MQNGKVGKLMELLDGRKNEDVEMASVGTPDNHNRRTPRTDNRCVLNMGTARTDIEECKAFVRVASLDGCSERQQRSRRFSRARWCCYIGPSM